LSLPCEVGLRGAGRDSRAPLFESFELRGGVFDAGGEGPSPPPPFPLISPVRMIVTGLAMGAAGGGGGGNIELL